MVDLLSIFIIEYIDRVDLFSFSSFSKSSIATLRVNIFKRLRGLLTLRNFRCEDRHFHDSTQDLTNDNDCSFKFNLLYFCKNFSFALKLHFKFLASRVWLSVSTSLKNNIEIKLVSFDRKVVQKSQQKCTTRQLRDESKKWGLVTSG